MTKQAILAIVVAIFILFGGVGAFLYSRNKVNAPAPIAANQTASPTKNNTEGSIRDILAGGKTSKCTFNTTSETGETAGTIYVDRDMARGDFVITTDGKNTNTHMIKNADVYYLWGDTLKTGIKMTMNIDEMSSKMKSADYSGFNPDQKVDYKCENWTKDETIFTPPSTVKFMSMDSLMPKNSSSPTNAKTTAAPSQSECSICNSLTNEAKTACLEQLNCQ